MSARKFDLFGRRKSFGNVKIERSVNGEGASISVYLHGNRVFKLYPEAHRVIISNCGWVTPTTVSAINTALSQVPLAQGVGVYIRKGVMYLSIGDKVTVLAGQVELDLISAAVGVGVQEALNG